MQGTIHFSEHSIKSGGKITVWEPVAVTQTPRREVKCQWPQTTLMLLAPSARVKFSLTRQNCYTKRIFLNLFPNASFVIFHRSFAIYINLLNIHSSKGNKSHFWPYTALFWDVRGGGNNDDCPSGFWRSVKWLTDAYWHLLTVNWHTQWCLNNR